MIAPGELGSRKLRHAVSVMALMLIWLVVSMPVAFAVSISHEQNPVSEIRNTYAVIDWQTDVDATSRVDYGLTTDLGYTKENFSFVKEHKLILDGLQVNKKYYYQMVSIAPDGSFKIDNNDGKFYSFTTSSTVDNKAPNIDNVFSFLNITDAGRFAVITWTNNEDSSNKVLYGVDALDQAISISSFGKEHRVEFAAQLNTTYIFAIQSCDISGNCATSSQKTLQPEQGPIPFTINIPSSSITRKIDITGTTRAGSRVTIFVNDQRSRISTADNAGKFKFLDVALQDTNVVSVEVIDPAGNQIKRDFNVLVDTVIPDITLSRIPKLALETPLVLTGNSSKPVKIQVWIKNLEDTSLPEKPEGLTASAGEGVVQLQWNAVQDEDFLEYGIYRNGVLIATSITTSFTDNGASANHEYNYRVSAVDNNCNQGSLSASIKVKTKEGPIYPDYQPTVFSCEKSAVEIQAQGSYTLSLDLPPGRSMIKVTATDSAGHVVTFQNETTLDTEPPRFVESNLEQLSPSYIADVTLRGKISEPATIFVYKGNSTKPVKIVATEEDGSYEAEITLTREIKISAKPKSIEATVDEGWTNSVRLEAVDLAGHKTVEGPKDIVYAACGFGGPYAIIIGDPLPDTLTPRLMLNNLQTVGFTINTTYKGTGKGNLRRVSVRPMVLSQEQDKEYDHGWVSVGDVNTAPGVSDFRYVQLNINARDLLLDEPNATTYDKEKALYEHRKGDCLVPGLGCVKVLLEVNIDASEDLPKRIMYNRPPYETTPENFTTNPIRQKSCVEFMLAVDKPFRMSDFAPSGFLKGTIEVLGNAVELIDKVLEPLITIGTFVLYSCFAMSAWLYFQFVSERWNCDASAALSVFAGQWDKKVAEIGACETYYADEPGKSSNLQKRNLCNVCQNSISRRKNFENTFRTVCDRVACPSAPSLQYYIKDKQESTVLDPIKFGDQTLYAGSSCAFTGKEQGSGYGGLSTGYSSKQASTITESFESGIVSSTASSIYAGSLLSTGGVTEIPLGYDFGKKGIKEIYVDYYQKHKDDKRGLAELKRLGKTPALALPGQSINCAGLHPANPECCGYEYMQDWGSACGIPGIVETFDEIKESACLAAQNANAIRDFESAATAASGKPVQCKSIFNAVAGFCEPETGQPVPELIPTGIAYKDVKNLASPADNQLMIMMLPKRSYAQQTVTYDIKAGYVANKFELQRTASSKNVERGSLESAVGKNANSQSFYLNQRLDVVSNPNTDLNMFFKPDALQVYRETGKLPAGFREALCKDVNELGACKQELVSNAYGEVVTRIGCTDKEFIVRPDQEGILRSVQCVCLPAVTSYLQFWKNILSAVQRCFQAVLLTKDGTPGVCQSVLSAYVCDFIYDLIRCFTQKYSTPGYGAQGGRAGIGNVLSTLTGAGQDVAQSVRSRYGNTVLWKVMFVDRKLLHSVCMFAFTGIWDLDVGGLFRQTVDEMPIESQAFLYPADRRFLGFNPTSTPRGVTKWAYHFGVGLAAGADLRYQLLLKCSNSARCSPAEGFKDGKCDCFGKQEILTPVSDSQLPGTLAKNELLDAEVFYPMEDTVRYDTAILRWEYADAGGNIVQGVPVETKISMVGGDAPSFCQFDTYALAYRCDVGIGQYSGAKFTRIPTPTYDTGFDVFKLDNQIQFNVDVQMQIPAQERARSDCIGRCPYTKWLTVDVKNNYGASLWSNKDNPEPLTTDGMNTLVFPLPIPDLKLDKKKFGKTLKQALYTDGLTTGPTGFKAFINSAVLEPEPKSERLQIVIAVNKDGAYEVFDASGVTVAPFDSYVPRTPENTATGAWGYWLKKQSLTSGMIKNNILAASLYSNTDKAKMLTLGFEKLPEAPVEIRIDYAGSGAEKDCSESDEPVQWTAEFTLHDSKKAGFGGGIYDPDLNQPTVDPTTNQPQKYTVPFNVVCSKTYAPKTTGETLLRCKPGVRLINACFCGPDSTYIDLLQKIANKEVTPDDDLTNCGKNAQLNYCYENECMTKDDYDAKIKEKEAQNIPSLTISKVSVLDGAGNEVDFDDLRTRTDYKVSATVDNDSPETIMRTTLILKDRSSPIISSLVKKDGKYTGDFMYASATTGSFEFSLVYVSPTDKKEKILDTKKIDFELK